MWRDMRVKIVLSDRVEFYGLHVTHVGCKYPALSASPCRNASLRTV